MYLMEVVTNKSMLDRKIKEVKRELNRVKEDDNLAQELFGLMDLRQAHRLNIQNANSQSTVQIGDRTLSIAAILTIMKTLKEKMDLITQMINDQEGTLEIVKLQDQRDKFFNEYTLLAMAVARNDLQVQLGDKT